LCKGVLFQCGRIKVLSRVATVDAPLNAYFGDDVGITAVTADISGTNIRLNFAVDDSVHVDITFDYNLQMITL
jgi:hypothetical protein